MRLKIDSKKGNWVKFVPEFEGNRELPEEEQISAEIHWLSHGEKKGYTKRITPFMKGRKMHSNADEIDREMFTDNIRNIKNLCFADGVDVTDPDVVYDSCPEELVNEFMNAINSYGKLNEEDEKN